MRQCVACRKKFAKKTLFRVAKIREGNIEKRDLIVIKPDCLQKFSGRGAYVCCNENCFKILKKKRCLEKSFKCYINDEIYEILERSIKFKEE